MTLPAIHFEPHTHPDGKTCYTTDCEYRQDVQEYDRKNTLTYTVTFASGSVEKFPFEDLIGFVEEWGLTDIFAIENPQGEVIYRRGWTSAASRIEKQLLRK